MWQLILVLGLLASWKGNTEGAALEGSTIKPTDKPLIDQTTDQSKPLTPIEAVKNKFNPLSAILLPNLPKTQKGTKSVKDNFVRKPIHNLTNDQRPETPQIIPILHTIQKVYNPTGNNGIARIRKINTKPSSGVGREGKDNRKGPRHHFAKARENDAASSRESLNQPDWGGMLSVMVGIKYAMSTTQPTPQMPGIGYLCCPLG